VLKDEKEYLLSPFTALKTYPSTLPAIDIIARITHCPCPSSCSDVQPPPKINGTLILPPQGNLDFETSRDLSGSRIATGFGLALSKYDLAMVWSFERRVDGS